ncbi:MAG TPA: hypothetical protein VFH89_12095 [Sphingomicrobium sp.]|nr:hypothetical protein [Sphingomicrobium sp.]
MQKRRIETIAERNERLKHEARERAAATDDAVDRMIRENVELHGP